MAKIFGSLVSLILILLIDFGTHALPLVPHEDYNYLIVNSNQPEVSPVSSSTSYSPENVLFGKRFRKKCPSGILAQAACRPECEKDYFGMFSNEFPQIEDKICLMRSPILKFVAQNLFRAGYFLTIPFSYLINSVSKLWVRLWLRIIFSIIWKILKG